MSKLRVWVSSDHIIVQLAKNILKDHDRLRFCAFPLKIRELDSEILSRLDDRSLCAILSTSKHLQLLCEDKLSRKIRLMTKFGYHLDISPYIKIGDSIYLAYTRLKSNKDLYNADVASKYGYTASTHQMFTAVDSYGCINVALPWIRIFV